jgi:hypothetical protein
MQAAIKNLVNKGLTDRRLMQLLLDAIRQMEMRNEASSVVRLIDIYNESLTRFQGGSH